MSKPPDGSAVEDRSRAVVEGQQTSGADDLARDPANTNAARPRPARAARAFAWLAGGWGVALAISASLPSVRTAFAALDHYPGVLVDFGIYHDQVRRLVAPQPSLSPHWLYPPLSALVLLGFGPLSFGLARGLWAGIQALLCVWLMLQCERRMPSLARPERWLCSAGLVLTSLPVAHCLKWGQLSVLVAMLSVIGLSRADWSGPLLLGSAIALKFYPAGYALAPLALGRLGWLMKLTAAVVMLGIGLPAVAFGPEIAGMLLGRSLGSAVTISSEPSIGYQTLAALLAKWFGSAEQLTASPGPLLFAVPGLVLRALSAVAALACVVVTLGVCRRRSLHAAVSATQQLRDRFSAFPWSRQHSAGEGMVPGTHRLARAPAGASQPVDRAATVAAADQRDPACLVPALRGRNDAADTSQPRDRASLVPASRQQIDAADVVAIMLCTTLLVSPAWMHYFVILPLGHAILLERARGRGDQLGLLLASFLLSAGSLSACLVSPAHFEWVQRTGALTVSALLCLFGLWTCGSAHDAPDGVGSAP